MPYSCVHNCKIAEIAEVRMVRARDRRGEGMTRGGRRRRTLLYVPQVRTRRPAS
jgi:hypothetical protein